MALKTKRWNIQDHIKTPSRQRGYLEAALELAIEENDPGFLADALGAVAKARGMAQVAEAVGITREGLYKALSKRGDPRLSTVLGVAKALGIRIRLQEPKRSPGTKKTAAPAAKTTSAPAGKTKRVAPPRRTAPRKAA